MKWGRPTSQPLRLPPPSRREGPGAHIIPRVGDFIPARLPWGLVVDLEIIHLHRRTFPHIVECEYNGQRYRFWSVTGMSAWADCRTEPPPIVDKL